MKAAATRRGLALAGLVSCALTLPACEPAGPETVEVGEAGLIPYESSGSAEGARWNYEGVLGVVVSVPIEGDPAAELQIQHEHIPGFRDPKSGEVYVNTDGVLGMRAMVMPMPPAEGMDVAPLAVGDKVRFTLSVWDEPRLSYRATRIERLDPATEISFENKHGP